MGYIFRLDKLGCIFPHKFIQCVSQHALNRLILIGNHTIDIDYGDQVRGVIDQGLPVLFCLFQLLLRMLARGDIAGYYHHRL